MTTAVFLVLVALSIGVVWLAVGSWERFAKKDDRFGFAIPAYLIAAGTLVAWVLFVVDRARSSGRQDSKIEMPGEVVNLIDHALEIGFLTREESFALNKWMNRSVRIQPKVLDISVSDLAIDRPEIAIQKVAAGKPCSAEERLSIAQWLARMGPKEMPDEVRDVLLLASANEDLDARDRRTVAAWLHHGTSSRAMTPRPADDSDLWREPADPTPREAPASGEGVPMPPAP